MTKFITVTPLDNYRLKISTDNHKIFIFDVLPEIQRIDCYKSLLDVGFFKTVKCNACRIYWDRDHDFHLDQILQYAVEIS
jgi:hypothetical protein